VARSAVSRGHGVTIQIEPPIEFILQQTGRFQEALLNLEPLWELVKPVAAQVEEEQFDTQGQGAWPALADSTLARKASGGWPEDPLIRTGDLKASLTDPGRAADVGPRHMIYGTDSSYAIFHQLGTSKMPQRQVIPDPYRVEDRRKIEAAMVSFVNAAARLTFGRI
jgi:phage gpG-like protein